MNPEQSQQNETPQYLEYWDKFYELNESLSEEYDDFEHAVTFTKRRFLALDKILAENFDVVGRDFVTEAKHWYYRTGSLNPMLGGSQQLARGAVVMERFCDDSEAKGYGYASFNDRLLAAAMYHEAGLVADEQSERNRLYLLARRNYEILLGSSRLQPTEVEHQNAIQFVADLDFQVLAEQSRLGYESPDRIRDVFEDLQIDYVNEFLAYLKACDDRIAFLEGRRHEPGAPSEKIGSSINGLKTNVSGSAFEWFTSLAYRHEIYASGDLARATIRTSFPREQHPRFWTTSEMKKRSKSMRDAGMKRFRSKKGPSHSFDKLIVTIDETGEEQREWVQLKTGTSSSQSYLPSITRRHAGLRHDRDNLPKIKVKTIDIGQYDDFIALLAVTANAMKLEYQHQKITQDDRELIDYSLSLLHPQPA